MPLTTRLHESVSPHYPELDRMIRFCCSAVKRVLHCKPEGDAPSAELSPGFADSGALSEYRTRRSPRCPAHPQEAKSSHEMVHSCHSSFVSRPTMLCSRQN